MFRSIARFGTVAAVLAVLSSPALADRKPSASELEKLTATLRAAGYTSWEEIELDDDGPWFEVDDARKADGTRWDLKLSPSDFQIAKADPED
ncbi:MAG: PepSY domain-containing protein [Pseudomonadota bacterium]|jgi:hypothetical protein|nr:PepSY domain-containing protein [Pseudomonadota bacterium]